MPKLVDHDARRRALADVAVGLIATFGLNAVTIRAVAAGAGDSTAIVTHYFEGKRQLLLYTYRFVSERAYRHIEAEAREMGGDLTATLAAALPTTEERRRDWLVWSVFLALAISDPEFSAIQREQYEVALRWTEGLLRRERGRATGRKAEARALLSFLIGLGMQAAFDPEAWPPALQLSVLRLQLDRR